MDIFKSQQLSSVPSAKNVLVHPIALFGAVDHYVSNETGKRVIGALLGTSSNGIVDVTNSYGVLFEDDEKDPNDITNLDQEYIEEMFSNLHSINKNEEVVGWYSTGPNLMENDLDIHYVIKHSVYNPVFVIIDVQPNELGTLTEAYCEIEEVKENVTQESQRVFVHVPSEIIADEIEEIGVKHLLRDVRCTTTNTLATKVIGKMNALKSLDARLKEICGYLDLVTDGKLPLNHEILYNLQEVFNLLPNLNAPDLIKALTVKTNDQMLVIYLCSLIRSVIALHNLINNKILNMEHEKAEDATSS